MADKGLVFNIQKFSLHDGPGIRSVVFFKGCPLKCFWCSNPESQSGKQEEMWDNTRGQMTTVGEYMTVDEIMVEVMKDLPFYEESGGGVTLSGGEVLFQANFAIKLLKALKAQDVHTACETTGFAHPKIFEEFINNVDMVYFDVKHHDTDAHMEGTNVKVELIIENLKRAIEIHPNVNIRVPVIPGFNDTLEDAKKFADLFSDLGVTNIEILPFHQFGESKYEYLNREYELQDIKQLHKEDLVEYESIINSRGVEVFIN